MIDSLTHIASDPLWRAFVVATLAALVFALAFRRQDANAPLMVGVIIALWALEIFLKAAMGDSFRAVLPLTDAVAAVVAYALGLRRPSDWLRAVYVTFVISCGLHVFQQWGGGAGALSKREYVTLLNALFALRLVFALVPGISRIGEVASSTVFGRSGQPSLALARREDAEWGR